MSPADDGIRSRSDVDPLLLPPIAHDPWEAFMRDRDGVKSVVCLN